MALDHHLHFHAPLFVCLCICELAGGGRETPRAESGGSWGGGAEPRGQVGGVGAWGGGGRYRYMMFILVLYLTVEDNRGLSVWLYEKNLNSNTKTFVEENLREKKLVMKKKQHIY